MSKLTQAVRISPARCLFCREEVADAISILGEGEADGLLVVFYCRDCGEKLAEAFPELDV